MEEQIAKTIIAAGFGVGVIVWFFALRCYRRMADAASVERLEARISGKSPAEAIKAILDGALATQNGARLSRPAENSLHISRQGVETRIDAQRTGGQTVVTADVDDAAMRRKLQIPMAILVVLVQPVVVAGVPAALWHFAAPSPAPAIRWQCMQVMQIIHILWPPFLLYTLWKKQRDDAIAAISNLLVRAEAS